MDSLPARLSGVIRRPRRTFEALVARPAWGRDCSTVLLLTTLTMAAGGTVFGTEVGRLALLDEWERSSAAFGHLVDDAEYARLQTLSQNGVAYGVARAVLVGPMALTAVAALVYGVFRRRGPDTRPGQVFTVVVHSGVVLALRQLVAAPAVLIRESTASATTLGTWFPLFDEASPVARLLAMLDFFVLWWLVVLAIGIAVLYGVKARRIALALVGLYLVSGAVMATVMALLGGTT